jgi:hypothetical protein
LSAPPDTSVGHPRAASSAPARRVIDSPDIEHSSRYVTWVTRSIFGNVRLKSDDDIYPCLAMPSDGIILAG